MLPTRRARVNQIRASGNEGQRGQMVLTLQERGEELFPRPTREKRQVRCCAVWREGKEERGSRGQNATSDPTGAAAVKAEAEAEAEAERQITLSVADSSSGHGVFQHAVIRSLQANEQSNLESVMTTSKLATRVEIWITHQRCFVGPL